MRGLAVCLLALPGLAAAQAPGKGPREIQSPINDHFYIRGSYYTAGVTTFARKDPTTAQAGTEISGGCGDRRHVIGCANAVDE